MEIIEDWPAKKERNKGWKGPTNEHQGVKISGDKKRASNLFVKKKTKL